MKISIGSDHGGFQLKEAVVDYLKKQKIEVLDCGCYNLDSVDYPKYAKKVCEDVRSGAVDFGILVCTTGIGMSIAANKYKGIRASLVSNSDAAYLTRNHNNSNVLCLSQKYTPVDEALKILDVYLNTEFTDQDRHLRRVKEIDEMEE